MDYYTTSCVKVMFLSGAIGGLVGGTVVLIFAPSVIKWLLRKLDI